MLIDTDPLCGFGRTEALVLIDLFFQNLLLQNHSNSCWGRWWGAELGFFFKMSYLKICL